MITAVPPSVSDRQVPVPRRRVTWAATAPPTTPPIAPPKPITREQQRSDVEHLLGEQHERRGRDHRRRVHEPEDDRHRAQQAVAPQPADALGELHPPRLGLAGLVTVGTERAGNQERRARRRRRTTPASMKNGSENATASRSDPSGGPTNVLATLSALHIRPLAFSSWLGVDDGGQDRLRPSCRGAPRPCRAAASPAARRGRDRSACPRPCRARPGRAAQPWRPRTANATASVSPKRQQVHRDHRLAAVDAIGDDAGWQREHEPRQPLRDDDQGDEQRVAGDRRRQPGVGDRRRRRRRGWR